MRRDTFKSILAVAFVAAVTASCSEVTGPEPGLEGSSTPTPFDGGGTMASFYSMSGSTLEDIVVLAADESAGESRWCSEEGVWFAPAAGSCAGRSGAPPFGQVAEEEGELVLTGTYSTAAPFVWTGLPGRENPFPEAGDFTIELRMKVDQLAQYGTGLRILDWKPATTEGDNSPVMSRLFEVWGDKRTQLKVTLLSEVLTVANPTEPHAYRVEYEDGAYTLFIDDEPAAGPIMSDVRPTAMWAGNPVFVYPGREWSDIRISQFTVSTPAPAIQLIEVPLDIKPGGCPSPLNRKARGVVPVAIAGTDDLDVTHIDPSTLKLEGVAAERHAFEDVTTAVEPYVGRTAADCAAEGADGSMDLTVKFSSEALADALSDAAEGEERTLTLTGNLLPEFGGTAITGEDVVLIRK